MKISVSLPDEDVDFLDGYAKAQGYDSRSAVVHKAVRLLKSSESELRTKTRGLSGRPPVRKRCGSRRRTTV